MEIVLDALGEALGAGVLGLFDDDRADHGEALNFFDAFGGHPCIDLDLSWRDFYDALKADRHVQSTCACGAEHEVHGFLIHDRWALLLVAPPAADAGAAVVLASALRALQQRLPPAKPPGPTPGLPEEHAPPRTVGPARPLLWVPKVRQ